MFQVSQRLLGRFIPSSRMTLQYDGIRTLSSQVPKSNQRSNSGARRRGGPPPPKFRPNSKHRSHPPKHQNSPQHKGKHIEKTNKRDTLRATLFCDANWLELRLLTWYAHQTYGEKFASSCAVDTSSLMPLLEEKINEVMKNEKHVSLRASVAFSSLAHKRAEPHLDLLRALAEQNTLVRNFPVGTNTPVCTPAIALTSDLLYSCSLKGSDRLDMAVILAGSPSYLPAIGRALLSDKQIVLATLKEDYDRMASIMPQNLMQSIIPVFIDDIFASLVVSLESFRAQGPNEDEFAQDLHRELWKRTQGSTIPSRQIAEIMMQSGLIVGSRRLESSIRRIFNKYSSLFDVKNIQNSHAYEITPIAQANPDNSRPSNEKSQSKEDNFMQTHDTSAKSQQTISIANDSAAGKQTEITPAKPLEQSNVSATESSSETTSQTATGMHQEKITHTTDTTKDEKVEKTTHHPEPLKETESAAELPNISSRPELEYEPSRMEDTLQNLVDETMNKDESVTLNNAANQSQTELKDASTSSNEEIEQPTPEFVPSVTLTEADIDINRLMEAAHSAGLVDEVKVKRDTLYQLLRVSGVKNVLRRHTRRELGSILAENANQVATAISNAATTSNEQ